jgi:predicted nucleic acid-binding protein
MLTDTGPLIALLDDNDRHHASCLAVVRSLPNQPLLTTWLCFTEAIYFLGEVGGYHFQESLWKLRRDGVLVLLDLTPAETDLPCRSSVASSGAPSSGNIPRSTDCAAC